MAGLADITEDRGPKLDQPDEGLELIVDISDDVPEAMFLDETYLTRVSVLDAGACGRLKSVRADKHAFLAGCSI